jgi:predicted HTH transcriptional regulator
MSGVAENIFLELKTIFRGPDPEAAFQAYVKNELTSVESTYFDYKTTPGLEAKQLRTDDKKNLAKAVSGFANTGGGVLIWGVEDGTLNLKAIPSVEEFASKLIDLVSKATEPVVLGIDRDILKLANGSGYVVILIPSSYRRIRSL